MAGHSHWAGIKHKKARVDKARAKLFSKLARKIIVAARNGGGDPNFNLTLKYAIDEAKAANMPKDNIDRSVKKGSGDLEGETYEEINYEAYGPGGSAFYVEALTDNKNRTASELRKLFDTRGGNLAGPGSVAWMFDKKGLIALGIQHIPEEELMDLVLEAGAEDIETTEEAYQITTGTSELQAVREAIENAIGPDKLEMCNIAFVPQNMLDVTEDQARKALKLYFALDEHDDIQNIWTNVVFTDAMLEELG